MTLRRGAQAMAVAIVAMVCFVAFGTTITPTAEVRADVPELNWCGADAGLAIGSTGSSVACLQFTLAAMGLYHATLTQKYDRATAEAMAIYQSNHPPLRVDGLGSPVALTEMGIYSGRDVEPPPLCLADARLGAGSSGESVKCLQDKLVKDGYLMAINATSKYDKPTADAVRAFQLATPPLTADGVAGPSTLAAMGIWSGKVTTQGGKVPTIAPNGPWPAGRQPYPNWNITAEGVPYYGNHIACTLANANVVAYEFAKDGADTATQQWAVYIASREGGCNFAAVNINPATRDDSHCTFQLNALAGMFEPHGELGRRGWTTDSVKQSLQNCADAASDLWVYCGRGPWTPPYACAPPWAGDIGFGDA